MKNLLYITFILSLISCNDQIIDDQQELAFDINNTSSEKSTDPRAMSLFSHQGLNLDELLELYKELSDIESAIVRSNSKNVVMYHLVNKGFFDNPALVDVEYLIKDQHQQWSNVSTVDANYRLFNLALDLQSELDVVAYEKSFRDKNTDKIHEIYGNDEQERIQYDLNVQLFQIKANLP